MLRGVASAVVQSGVIDPSARSGDLLRNGYMLVMWTTEDPTDPLCELISAQQTVGLYHLSLAPWIHFGSMAFSHGLCLGRRQLTILTPASLPFFLTSRLCLPSQRLTSLETCQLALSQIRSRTFLAAASSF